MTGLIVATPLRTPTVISASPASQPSGSGPGADPNPPGAGGTGVGSLIHLYSVAYMEHDERRRRFFGYLNL
ncbi:hypothetical protein ABZ038_38765, partial [Streptomyces sp. NPDC006349]|uniref:hypothetical protein n=1 Tax=Streptomyces sp. NPDC006349 TaxID=3156757 RepID=UPI0033A0F4DB